MRPSRQVTRIVLLLFFSSIAAVAVYADDLRFENSSKVEAIIDKAEASFAQGHDAFVKGDVATARKLFDKSIDEVLLSGIDIRTNSRLESYYRELVDRIHKHEALPGDDHKDLTVPSLLDELSKITDADLATVTSDGIKIYGKYDFDFSIAQPALQFMNFFISGRGRSTMEIGLQRAGRYRQLAEKIFKEERVPVDLIWLAQAESVWKPNAMSRAAARGIWQFVPSTGTRYGLSQTAWVDDRSNPEKSTRAAARYLRWLHDHFAGDWLLAMAAYNAGENRVDEAIARCGYADFWELHRRGLLPQETRNYVPTILSIMIISKNQHRYGFNVNPDPAMTYDTYELPGQTDLKVIADICGVPGDSLQDLNPELRRGTSPPGEQYTIKLPKGTRKTFELAFANLPEDQRVRKVVVARDEPRGRETVENYRSSYRTQLVAYHARSGDTLSTVSRRYGISVHELARVNRLSAHGSLHRGQTVRVPMEVRASSRRGQSVRAYGRYHEQEAVRSNIRGRYHRSYGRAYGRRSHAHGHWVRHTRRR